MICFKCKNKMEKVDLRFSSFVGHTKYAYSCPICEKRAKADNLDNLDNLYGNSRTVKRCAKKNESETKTE